MRRLIPALLAVSLLLALAGLTVASVFHGAPDDELAEVVPSDSLLYVNVFLDPSTRQGRSIQAFFDILDLPDLTSTLDELLAECDTDLASLTGSDASQIAMFVASGGAAGCVTDSTEPPSGGSRQARIRGRWVVGDPEAIAAAIRSSRRQSLAFDPSFTEHVRRVGPDRVGLIYSGDDISVEIDGAIGVVGRVLRFVPTPTAVAVRSEGGRFVLDASAEADGSSLWPQRPSFGVGAAPKTSWLAWSLPDLPGTLDAIRSNVLAAGIADEASIDSALDRLLGPDGRAVLRESTDGVAWVGGPPLAPFGGALTDLGRFDLGEPSDEVGTLGSSDRYIDASEWLGSMPVAGYADARVAGPWLTLGASLAGLELPFERLDRVVVGVQRQSGSMIWRLVVSASEPNG